MKKRDIRRHHRARLQAKRCRYHWGRKLTSPFERGFVVNTPTSCSCWQCGNPRKWFKQKTIQERKQYLKDE